MKQIGLAWVNAHETGVFQLKKQEIERGRSRLRFPELNLQLAFIRRRAYRIGVARKTTALVFKKSLTPFKNIGSRKHLILQIFFG